RSASSPRASTWRPTAPWRPALAARRRPWRPDASSDRYLTSAERATMALHCWRLRCTLVVTCVLACGGCKSGVALAPVQGTVTLEGKPLAKGTIRFESTGHRPATGQILNGEIVELTTYQTGDGVPVGAHKVAIWSSAEAASAIVANPGESKVGGNYMSGKSLINTLYNDPETSGLTAEIKSGDNVVTFELFANPKKSTK